MTGLRRSRPASAPDTATCWARDPSGITRPAASRVEIVAGEQRRPAPAEMMALARIQQGRVAADGKHSRCVKNISIVGSGEPADAHATSTPLAVGLCGFAVAVVSSPIDAQRAGSFRGSARRSGDQRRDRAAEQRGRRRQPEAAGRRHVRLTFDGRGGFLRSALDALQIPVDSQLLVFSRASLQGKQIGEQNPRAVFFNDRVALGWVRDGDIIEVAAHDESAGVVFYTLDQRADTRSPPSSSAGSSVSDVTWPAIRLACPAS